jgi:hypothetical protein
MIAKWQRRAWLFIWRQRRTELKKAIERYPYSERLEIRENELAEIEDKIAEYEAEDNAEESAAST